MDGAGAGENYEESFARGWEVRRSQPMISSERSSQKNIYLVFILIFILFDGNENRSRKNRNEPIYTVS
jgi:hypothetical protein